MEQEKHNTALANYDAELAKIAAAHAKQEAHVGSGGQFFSIRGGALKLGDNAMPGNQIAVVVLDALLENTYYQGEFDPDEPSGPVCYAFGHDVDSMAPHPDCDEKQADACKGCPNNEFGSADKGRGKACKNRRRLALLPAGAFDRDGVFEQRAGIPEIERGEVCFMTLPPTSLVSWANYVKSLSAKGRPPFAHFTRIALVPDPKSQIKVTFEDLGAVPAEMIPAVMQRAKAQADTMPQPYPKASEREERSAKPAHKQVKRKY